jgi:predicted adenylyl cyclase CyaB
MKKTRWLYMVGQTRVHCDTVEGLGDFAELEVVLEDNQSVEDGQLIADDLMEKLGIEKTKLIKCAYMDLLDAQNKNQ